MSTTTADVENGLASRDDGPGWQPIIGNRWALLLAAPLLFLVVALVGYPLVKLGVDALTTGEGLGNFGDVLSSQSGRRALISTLIASVVVAVLSVSIGAMLAWYIRTSERLWVTAGLWLVVLVPFFMGTVTKNYSLVLLLADNGPLNEGLAAIGLGRISILYTSSAVVIGMTYTMIPYAVFSLYGVFLSIDTNLVGAARSMGASRLRAALTVTLPLAAPGLLASTALIFAISLGFYVTPVLLGGAQVPFMASLIQDNVLAQFNYPFASAASVLLLLAAILILGIALRLVGRERLMRAVA